MPVGVYTAGGVAWRGVVQGYALVEYERKEEAENAIASMNGKPLLGQNVSVDWAFIKGTCGW